MKLPNRERAVVDEAKLTDYCLNPDHLHGKHKARVFSSALGLEAKDAEQLRDALMAVARDKDAEFGKRIPSDSDMC